MLPNGDLEASLIVASSYSGNTAETLRAFEMAQERGLALAAVSTGGTLLDNAEKAGAPLIRIPSTDIQPRSALGFETRALLKLFGDEAGLRDTKKLSTELDGEAAEDRGKALAKKLKGKIPIIYASGRNKTLAHIWKIKFNETAKVPAFCNTFPELNHNEMIGFDVGKSLRSLAERFHFIFLRDDKDDPAIMRRMEETAKIFKKRKMDVESVELRGQDFWYRVFDNLWVSDWVTLHLARHYGVNPDEVPLVEEFKKRLA